MRAPAHVLNACALTGSRGIDGGTLAYTMRGPRCRCCLALVPWCHRIQAALSGLLSALIPRVRMVPAVRPEDMSPHPEVCRQGRASSTVRCRSAAPAAGVTQPERKRERSVACRGACQLGALCACEAPQDIKVFQADPLIFHPMLPVRTGAEGLAAFRALSPRYADFTLPVYACHGTAVRAVRARSWGCDGCWLGRLHLTSGARGPCQGSGQAACVDGRPCAPMPSPQDKCTSHPATRTFMSRINSKDKVFREVPGAGVCLGRAPGAVEAAGVTDRARGVLRVPHRRVPRAAPEHGLGGAHAAHRRLHPGARSGRPALQAVTLT